MFSLLHSLRVIIIVLGEILREHTTPELSQILQLTGMTMSGRQLVLACGSAGLALFHIPAESTAAAN